MRLCSVHFVSVSFQILFGYSGILTLKTGKELIFSSFFTCFVLNLISELFMKQNWLGLMNLTLCVC